MSVRVGFGGPDYASIRFLKEWPRGFYISPLVDCFDVHLQEFLIKQYFENGAALFGRDSALELQKVRDWARGYLRDASDRDVYLIVQYFVQRVRNYAHLNSLSGAVLQWARSVPDGCESLPAHPSWRIDIVDATKRLRWFKTLSLYEYGNWVYGKDHGFPPFDLSCSCRMEGIVPGV